MHNFACCYQQSKTKRIWDQKSGEGEAMVGAQRLELWTDGLRVRCSTN